MKPSGRITRQVKTAKHLAEVIDEQGTVSDEAVERLLRRAAEQTADQAKRYKPISVFFQAEPDPDDGPMWNAPAPGTCCPECTHHRTRKCEGCNGTRCQGKEVQEPVKVPLESIIYLDTTTGEQYREIEVTARVVE